MSAITADTVGALSPKTRLIVAAERTRLPRRVWVGISIVAAYVLTAVFAPLIAPYDPLAQDVVNSLAAPSAAHWLGTDELGRDVLSRLIYASRIDLLVGFLGAALPAVLGTFLGAVGGFRGGWLDGVIMRVSDVVQAFPTYILIIALVFALGPGVTSILVAFTLIAWVSYARLIRTEVLRERGLDYVSAARASGLSGRRTLWRHVFPNSVGQTLVYLPSDIVGATLGLAALSFLGLGIQAPTPEWGAMIAAGQPYIREQWWLSTVPGLVVVGFGLGLSLVGEGIEEWTRK
ncbi:MULTISPECIES: ABC transporter permease [unclassified Microbacterium]|uniref:ABC transporter permease n=1 Tax=unclassified Microbacterium TaxID=2609290 RepID=UPI000CFB495E|nr:MULTISPECIES: ABC transporter permease [unclassified Microbacterium]PQZ54307.1 nickel ABC transporter permease [Microbacterium sp. MYb43]PQZ75391.1 nickel ABC transporter permease [Microbacterium sp. MYb40]PRB19545.1 nickel ABC transporter permease [Microbacterium sp. MYb54]PRB25767.1 nickel ABC transporter permease [Microbacterium sp. MYb50]PRB64250.1 nickel ABC transporter permease [Microbacterium sp. MYb24]